MTTASLALLFAMATQTNGLPEGLLSAVCFVESSHRPGVIHIDDGNGSSLGVCQIKLSTAEYLGFAGTTSQLMNPKTNIKYASMYLRTLLNRYDGNLVKAISAYNMGHYKERKPGYPTNKYYVDKVFAAWKVPTSGKETAR